MAEGYIYGMEKKGYYVSPVQRPLTAQLPRQDAAPPAEHHWEMDLVTNSIAAEDFPFTVWARLMRQTILEQGTGLLHAMPPQGAPELRRAIAAYLRQFRGMTVDAEQIIIGAGTEVLYSMLVQLLGRDKRYAVEEPGYGKITRIYRSNQAEVVSVPLDAAGLSVSALDAAGADVVHISPSHHYPTGIVMPIARRQELLHWAERGPDRFILEDDYDSEFRFVGRPIPTLFSVDESGRVIYLNTFSKTIAPSIRISYMVLPHRLLAAFRKSWASMPAPSPASSSTRWPGSWRRATTKTPEPHAQALPPEARRGDRLYPRRAAGRPRPHHRGGRGPALPDDTGYAPVRRDAAPSGGAAGRAAGHALRILQRPRRRAAPCTGDELFRHRHRKAAPGAGASGGDMGGTRPCMTN